MKRIYNQTWNDKHRQSVFRLTFLQVGAKSVKVEVCRNAYDQQSYAQLYHLANDRWELILNFPAALMHPQTLAVNYAAHKINHTFGMEDEQALLELYAEVTGV